MPRRTDWTLADVNEWGHYLFEQELEYGNSGRDMVVEEMNEKFGEPGPSVIHPTVMDEDDDPGSLWDRVHSNYWARRQLGLGYNEIELKAEEGRLILTAPFDDVDLNQILEVLKLHFKVREFETDEEVIPGISPRARVFISRKES
jgi:hypothetical protein